MPARFKLYSPEKTKKYFETKLACTTGPAELKFIMDEGEPPNIIDVRAAKDYAEAHIPGAINLPEEQWRSATGLTKKNVNILYCYTVVCQLATRAAIYFAGKGYPVKEMEGGFEAWKDYGYETEKGQPDAEKPEQQKVA